MKCTVANFQQFYKNQQILYTKIFVQEMSLDFKAIIAIGTVKIEEAFQVQYIFSLESNSHGKT